MAKINKEELINNKPEQKDINMSNEKTEMNKTAEEKKESSEETKNNKSKKQKSLKSKEKKMIQKLEEKIKKLEDENKQLKDQSLRRIAELENYKRRTEKEFLAHLEYANEGLISDLLPAIDDFERSLEHSEKTDNNDSLKEGVVLIYKKLMSTLEKKGLKKMESVGQEFDPEKHQALMNVESDKYESGYVIEEHLKGYTLNDKVIRHSQVMVTK